jgi:hypothetical protein
MHWLYPWPVVPGQKYLIELKKLGAARLLEMAIQRQILEDSTGLFLFNRWHDDGVTPIYTVQLKQFRMRFLHPGPEQSDHAASIESILSQSLLAGDLDRARRLFENQKSCSSCQAIGILAPSVSTFFEEALACWNGAARGFDDDELTS